MLLRLMLLLTRILPSVLHRSVFENLPVRLKRTERTEKELLSGEMSRPRTPLFCEVWFLHPTSWCLTYSLLVRRAQRKDPLPLRRSLDHWSQQHAHPLFWGVGRLFLLVSRLENITNDLGRDRTGLRRVITAEAAEFVWVENV